MYQWPDITDANKLYILDSHTGEILRTLETGRDTLTLVPDISPDGRIVGIGDWEGTVYLWEADSGELIKTMDCLNWAHNVRWSPDGSKIAMLCNADTGQIQVMDADTYEILLTIEEETELDIFGWFNWSPDSTRIAVAGGDDQIGTTSNPVYIFDANSGQELLKIDRHSKVVSQVYWSPNGKRVVSGSTDDTTRVWDAETGAELLTLSTPGDWIVFPAWSPDGQHLLVMIYNTTGGPGKSGVWRVWQTTEELIEYAKECCVYRELTPEERQQFGLPPR
jgi:WD40 repeat protein